MVKVYSILPSHAEHCTQYSRSGLSWVSHNWIHFSSLLTVSWSCPCFLPFFCSLMLVLCHPVIELACFSLIVLLWIQLMAILLTAEGFALNLNVSSLTHYSGLSIHLHPVSSLVLKVVQFSEYNTPVLHFIDSPSFGCVIAEVYLLLPHFVPGLLVKIPSSIGLETCLKKPLLIASFQLESFP